MQHRHVAGGDTLAEGWFYGEADPVACSDYIEQNSTDIRPKSLRERLAQGQAFDT